jgi:hypothetical protein
LLARALRNLDCRRAVGLVPSSVALLLLHAALHLLVELVVVVGFCYLLIALTTLKLVELVDVTDHHLNYKISGSVTY